MKNIFEIEIGIPNSDLKNLVTEFDQFEIEILIFIPNYRIRISEFNSNSVGKSEFFNFAHP